MSHQRLTLTIAMMICLSSYPFKWSSAHAAPLRVHPSNSRYFVAAANKTVLLAGMQRYDELQDHGWGAPLPVSWDNHLSWMAQRGLNYDRVWISLFSRKTASAPIVSPMPYKRVSGSGLAADGQNKFDLDQFEPAFFARVKARCQAAQRKQIYLSIMLFDRWSWADDVVTKPFNVFRQPNNVNGVNWDYTDFFTTTPAVLARQKAFIDKILAAINDPVEPCDNVVIEVANEPPVADAWHTAIISYLRTKESALYGRNHLVYVSTFGKWGQCTTQALKNMGASVASIVTGGQCDAFNTSPPPNSYGLPVIADEDHIGTCVRHQDVYLLPWKTLARGYHYCYYEPKENPENHPEHDVMRRNLGKTADYAHRIEVKDMNPGTTSSCSTGFCLVKPAQKYIALQPGSGAITLHGLASGTKYDYEWYRPDTNDVAGTGSVTVSSTSHTFTPPFSGAPAVLYLKKAAVSASCGDGVCNGGETCSSCPADCGACGALPPPWQTTDVGQVGLTGAATATGDDVFEVSGSGTDIWDNVDGFRFVYQPLDGDGEIVARVVSQSNTHVWAKAGPMIRETLEPGSRHAMVVVTPERGVAFQRRTVTGGVSYHTPGSSSTAPRWVRLRREGDAITADEASELDPAGPRWQHVGSVQLPMGGPVHVGMAVTGHNNAASSTAVFDGVRVAQTGAPIEICSLTFGDVASSHWASYEIHTLLHLGMLKGCQQQPLLYCPDRALTRAAAAVMLLRARLGADYEPPPAEGLFTDMPKEHWAAAWAEQLLREGITKGCDEDSSRFCPDKEVSRAMLAVLLLRNKHGGSYEPPPAEGLFTDMPEEHWAVAWAEQLLREGITKGCGGNPSRFCPEQVVDRAAMAVSLVRTFELSDDVCNGVRQEFSGSSVPGGGSLTGGCSYAGGQAHGLPGAGAWTTLGLLLCIGGLGAAIGRRRPAN